MTIFIQTAQQEKEGLVIGAIMIIVLVVFIVWAKIEQTKEDKWKSKIHRLNKVKPKADPGKTEWLIRNPGAIPACNAGFDVFMKDKEMLLKLLVLKKRVDLVWDDLLRDVNRSNPELAQEVAKKKNEKRVLNETHFITGNAVKDKWLCDNTDAIPAFSTGLNVFLKDREALLKQLLERHSPEYIWSEIIEEVMLTNPELALKAKQAKENKSHKIIEYTLKDGEEIDDAKKRLYKEYEGKGFNVKIEIDHTKKRTRSRRIRQDVKDKVWNRDGGKCVQCGSNENLEFDHIIPFSKGGANTYRNLQLLCESCNRSKSDKIG